MTLTMSSRKTIALIAHDNKKATMLEWVRVNRDVLAMHNLCGTGTTASILAKETGLPIQAYYSGPLGGDQQIGSRIAEGEIDCVIFFSDPLTAQPHDPDVKALLRIAQVYDIVIANNPATADFVISSPFMTSAYHREVDDFRGSVQDRAQAFVDGRQR